MSRLATFALQGLRVIALLAMAATVAAVALDQTRFEFGASLAWAFAVYLVAHLVRALRLVLLSARPDVGVRRIVLVHFFTAGFSAVTPLKMGDFLRIAEIAALTKSLPRGLAIYWGERASDAFVLIPICLVAVAGENGLSESELPFLGSITLFVLLSVAALIVLPENIRRLRLFTLRKYAGARAVQILQVLSAFRDFSEACKEVTRHKLSSIVLLSIAVWVLELTSFAMAAEVSTPVMAMAGLVSQLSHLHVPSLGETAQVFAPARVDAYSRMILLVTGGLGLIAGIVLLRRRRHLQSRRALAASSGT